MLKRLLARAAALSKRNAKSRKNIQIGEFSYGDPHVFMFTGNYWLVIGKFVQSQTM